MQQELSWLNGGQRRATRQTLWSCLLSLFVVLALAGCKPAAQVTSDINPVGTYALASVDGNKVPCALTHDGHALTVKSGTFIINPDGTCSSRMVFSPPSGSEASKEVKATYTRQGATLTMRWEGAGTTTGTVEGDTFTMNNEGMVLVYRK